jgi:hypothetical protein
MFNAECISLIMSFALKKILKGCNDYRIINVEYKKIPKG